MPQTIADQWSFDEGVTYLNHGSFGPSPKPVRQDRAEWLERLERSPMDFFVRRLSGELEYVTEQLGEFLGRPSDNLVLLPNATAGMNIVAANVELVEGDEVLLTDHEYGAVVRIWGQACQRQGARTVLARLPLPLDSEDDIVQSIISRVTPRTRVIVVSHVTSQTAARLPVEAICEQARARGILSVVDGPHALAMVEHPLKGLNCDFYTASCHKWLCAPFGSGLLFVKSRLKQGLKPTTWSWGRSLSGEPASWRDEFHWPGTADPTPLLAIPAAIKFLTSYGLTQFQNQTHAKASLIRKSLLAFGGVPLTPDSTEWYGSMVSLPVPGLGNAAAFPGGIHPLQKWLWETHRIEVPVIRWKDQTLIRVSCHLYTTDTHLNHLTAALQEWTSQTASC